ncbi:MAG: DUF134 domain-containing protein [Deltaproteobacteria bacterium]|nr:DUF134 domain-containing protein [Deltaproteobacteria bacterium]MBW1922522.1 DUF134 domain-containing protein [Deltaproteobacteria bacterium]MBW1948379.1 DUF134 domain-containing protein [Deltaproteobacteria bacterium]MBW2007116.1 DUF134 domain-containing protein [Deltaproteobacteria bacterium]MBW2103267.1 DUF134 domain-containing protein [Deltaproteobacteria bacterium]
MPRPRKPRFVQAPPLAETFTPHPPSRWGGEEVFLPVEGLEAIRLSDYLGLDHDAAAKLMNVSRQTFGRILAEARALVAEALVMGKILRIQGGHFRMPPRGPGRHGRRWRGGF